MRLVMNALAAIPMMVLPLGACSRAEPTEVSTPADGAQPPTATPSAPGQAAEAPAVAEGAPKADEAMADTQPEPPLSGADAKLALVKLLGEHRGDCTELVAALRPFVAKNGASLRAFNGALVAEDPVARAEMTRKAQALSQQAIAMTEVIEACSANTELAALLMSTMPSPAETRPPAATSAPAVTSPTTAGAPATLGTATNPSAGPASTAKP
jgi:hypothetical protein